MSEPENIVTELTISDIALMLQIIEVCAKRGAFQASEFVTIGNLSAKLSAIIPSSEEVAPPGPPPPMPPHPTNLAPVPTEVQTEFEL
jgi:hypothetical protein